MKLLVIGSGGREHALAWKLAQSERVSQVFVAPGNGGTAGSAAQGNGAKVENLAISDVGALADFAKTQSIAFTVVGPEAPLSKGIVDVFRVQGLAIFGPTQAAAQLESSKDFAKAFMVRHDIPTAFYETFTDAALAHAYVNAQGAPIVIKADGLAAGKGVVVAQTLEEAHAAIDAMLSDNKLGSAGARVVIEECLFGEEASFIVMVDGENVLPLASSQDHKRLLNADQGPNTGGMGAYSPAPVVTETVYLRALNEVIYPTVAGMAKEGIKFTGFLYAGLMIDADQNIKVLEFNCRMGDPETQPIMVRLQSDLSEVIEAAIAGNLDQVELQWDERVALGVVLAASGYPEQPRSGDVISLPNHIQDTQDCTIFHAGTALVDGVLQTSGGRVLCVTALGDDVRQAQQKAYALILGLERFDVVGL
jgi:phosphoribosylamine---glycine ligase